MGSNSFDYIDCNRLCGVKMKKYWKKLYYWLRWRKKRRYSYSRRLEYVLKNLFFVAISIIALIYVYHSFETLSFIGWAILLVALYFGIKHSFRLMQESGNWYSRQINLVKIVLICGIIVLLFHGYQNKDILSEKFNEIDLKSKINFNDSLFSGVGDSDESELSPIQKVFYTAPERKEECQEEFGYVNLLRNENGKKSLDWDERAYKLAVDRSKDMYERNYFDHVTPEGECVYTMKKNYGFNSFEFVAENIGASMWEGGSYTKDIDVKGQVDGWMESRGHRYNLLYSTHKSGVIGCYYGVCVFLGVNNDGFGEGCNTGDEGLVFWEEASIQPGEV